MRIAAAKFAADITITGARILGKICLRMILKSEDTAMKYEAWGWNVVTINAHNHDEIKTR